MKQKATYRCDHVESAEAIVSRAHTPTDQLVYLSATPYLMDTNAKTYKFWTINQRPRGVPS